MKFESMNLDKFKSAELKGFEASKIKGGSTTYEVTFDRDTGRAKDTNILTGDADF